MIDTHYLFKLSVAVRSEGARFAEWDTAFPVELVAKSLDAAMSKAMTCLGEPDPGTAWAIVPAGAEEIRGSGALVTRFRTYARDGGASE